MNELELFLFFILFVFLCLLTAEKENSGKHLYNSVVVSLPGSFLLQCSGCQPIPAIAGGIDDFPTGIGQPASYHCVI